MRARDMNVLSVDLHTHTSRGSDPKSSAGLCLSVCPSLSGHIHVTVCTHTHTAAHIHTYIHIHAHECRFCRAFRPRCSSEVIKPSELFLDLMMPAPRFLAPVLTGSVQDRSDLGRVPVEVLSPRVANDSGGVWITQLE